MMARAYSPTGMLTEGVQRNEGEGALTGRRESASGAMNGTEIIGNAENATRGIETVTDVLRNMEMTLSIGT